MAPTYIEAQVEGLGNILRVDAPFDEALIALQDKGVRHPTSTYELVDSRLQFPKSHSLNDNGSYNKEGFLYAKSQPGLLVLNSPLLDIKLARVATQFNREGRYFSTENTELYGQYNKIAKDDENKAPEEREVLELPSRRPFPISSRENEDIFRALFKNKGQQYLEFIRLDKIMVYPVASDTIDSQSGTLLTQLWLRGLGSSFVVGDSGSLGYDLVRGVSVSGEASVPKIEDQKIKTYTPNQLSTALQNLGISSLEKQILEELNKTN